MRNYFIQAREAFIKYFCPKMWRLFEGNIKQNKYSMYVYNYVCMIAP